MGSGSEKEELELSLNYRACWLARHALKSLGGKSVFCRFGNLKTIRRLEKSVSKAKKTRAANLLDRLTGMTVALATPLDERGRVHMKDLRKLVDRALAGGAAGFLALGWCGEQPLLMDADRRLVLETIVEETNGRIPVIAGVSEQSLPRALAQAKMARAVGADLILSTPPYSYPLGAALLAEYFARLAGESRMGLIVYNNHEVGVHVDLELAARLAKTDGVVGIKDTSTMSMLQRLLSLFHRPGRFIILSGDEYHLGPGLLVGVTHTTMGGPGNLCPWWCSDIHLAARQNRWADVAAGHRRLVQFCDALYALGPSPYAIVKVALSVLGYGSGLSTPPLPAPTAAQRKAVARLLKKFPDVVPQA